MSGIRGGTAKTRAGSSARAARNRAAIRSMIEERDRASVYRTDVEFAPPAVPVYPKGYMDKLAKPVRELAARGLSQLKIANELGISQGSVSSIMRKHRITKGTEKR